MAKKIKRRKMSHACRIADAALRAVQANAKLERAWEAMGEQERADFWHSIANFATVVLREHASRAVRAFEGDDS